MELLWVRQQESTEPWALPRLPGLTWQLCLCTQGIIPRLSLTWLGHLGQRIKANSVSEAVFRDLKPKTALYNVSSKHVPKFRSK